MSLINKNLTMGNTFSSVEHLDFEMKLPYLPKKMQELVSTEQQDVMQSCFLLGYLFDTGMPVENFCPDTEQAIFWYSKAASLGHTIAKLNLGILYETGHQGIVSPDYLKAVNWYSSAVDAGHPGAMFNLGRLIWAGKGICQNTSDAFELFMVAAKKGNVMAMSNVGAMYMSGNGIDTNYILALKWLTRAVAKGCCVAYHNLGIMYENGWGVNKDIEQAIIYFRLARFGTQNPVSKEMSAQLRDTRETLLYT